MVNLFTWLSEQKEALLARWIASAEPVAAGNHSIAGEPAALAGSESGERDLLLASIYNGFIEAARGNTAPLDECLRLMHALRTSEGESELSERLETLFLLRRVVWDAMFADTRIDTDRRQLLGDFELLLEQATRDLTEHWTRAANEVRKQLTHSELFAQSLAESAEQADQIAVQMHNLNSLAAELAASLDPHVLVLAAGSKLAEVLEFANLSIWLLDANSQLVITKCWGEPLNTLQPLDFLRTNDILVQTCLQRQPLIIADPETSEQGSWYLPGHGVFATPLIARDMVIGLIVAQDPQPEHNFAQAQQEFMTSVANQSSIALQNAQLYAKTRDFNTVLEGRIAERTRELQLERDMLSTLNQIALEVSSTLDLDLLLENCLSALAELVGVEHGAIMLIEDDTQHLVDRSILGRSRDSVGFTRFPIGQGIAGWVAQNRKPALVPDVSDDERWVELPRSELGRKMKGSMALVPLIVQNEVTGVMSLSHDENSYFTEGHMRLLTASASAIALGINNARLYDEILRESMRKGEMLQNERRATTQSNAILQSLSDGVIVCDVDGGVLTANPAAERVLGLGLEDLLIMPLPDLLHRLLLNRAKEIPIEAVLTGRNPSQSHATNFQRGKRMIRVSLDPVTTEREEVIGAVAVFRDITREVESERLKDEFIGTVSHELRTPMTSIKGFTQLLSMGSLGPVNDQQKEFLQTIHTNAERMILIINDLLDITKIEAGSVELDIRPIHVAEALGNVIMDVQNQIRTREHELQIHIPPGLPLVRADARRFDQILANLMTNAIKYTPRGGTVTVRAQELARENLPPSLADRVEAPLFVQIDVVDTGIGISAEEQEKIFNRFYRTENRLKIEAGGTGLGLSLVRPLVKLFGGTIWLTSFPEEGSTFSFIIPAVR